MNLVLKLLWFFHDSADFEVLLGREIGAESFVGFVKGTFWPGFIALFLLFKFQPFDFLFKMLSFFDKLSDFINIVFLRIIF